LENYIQSIRDVAIVLNINESESQVLQQIVEGLNPTQRARFVFQGPAVSFKHLDYGRRNITFTDQTREPVVSTSRAGTEQSTSDDVISHPSRTVQSKTPTQDKRPICYYCEKLGHFQRNCFARENSKRKFVKATTSRS
jgi:hypothetical protein